MTEENKINDSFSKELDQFFNQDVATNPEEETKLDVANKEEEPESEQIEDEALVGEEESKETPEDEKQDSEIEEIKELERKLGGQPKEFKELVKSVKDKELQTKILEAGKVARAREDRVSLELGNLKKEYSNVSGLLKFLDTNPAEAIKHIAKVVKIDLKSLTEPVEDSYDYNYRTPEEIERDKQLESIKQELQQLKNQKINDEFSVIEQEVENFANDIDESGDLKYPHFDVLQSSIKDILELEKVKLGLPKNSQERISRLKKAYEKAVILDDELSSKRDEQILRKARERKELEIEKAKKLKKLSIRSSSFGIKPASSKDALSEIYDRWSVGNI